MQNCGVLFVKVFLSKNVPGSPNRENTDADITYRSHAKHSLLLLAEHGLMDRET
jgi:hypothetical protein